MTAQNGEGVYGDGVGVVTPLAHKLSQNGPLVKDSTGKPRSGVFYAGNASLVSGKANMSYDVAPFEAAICRARTKGTSFPTNDAVKNVTTTAAPGSNSRIDIIYFQQQEVSEGDAATQAVIGVVQGTAASSPSAPTLPDGAIELARATIAAGITATTSATITQTAPFTAPLGARVPFRTTTEMNAWTPQTGQQATDLSSGIVYRHNGSAWKPWESDWVTYTPTFANLTPGNGTLTARYKFVNGACRVQGKLVLGSTSAVGSLPTINHPVTADSITAMANRPLGTLFLLDAGTAFFTGQMVASDTTKAEFRTLQVGGTYLAAGGVLSTVPFTFTSTDILDWDYEITPA